MLYHKQVYITWYAYFNFLNSIILNIQVVVTVAQKN